MNNIVEHNGQILRNQVEHCRCYVVNMCLKRVFTPTVDQQYFLSVVELFKRSYVYLNNQTSLVSSGMQKSNVVDV